MSKRTFIGDRLVIEGTIEKQADDNKGCERVEKEIETDDDHEGIQGGYLIIGKKSIQKEADDDERVQKSIKEPDDGKIEEKPKSEKLVDDIPEGIDGCDTLVNEDNDDGEDSVKEAGKEKEELNRLALVSWQPHMLWMCARSSHTN
ncbi:hypothetical protein M9H77_34758 [Catharanthus roseus]|uniref:Uncharacterized protein n=1 Tax=Catharanthus roseus TaxID=4058 RepID=A0ACB9ZMC6_CATRO|nr:hypothetical protein M9H77_34758 [Catharanthus roseus]